MMRRLIVLEVFSGPAWRDASDMAEHVDDDDGSGAWLLIEPGSIRVVPPPAHGDQVLRDVREGGPAFHCQVQRTTGGPDRPTVHTVAGGDADLYEELLISVGFRTGSPDGIQLQKDESGTYWGYYV